MSATPLRIGARDERGLRLDAVFSRKVCLADELESEFPSLFSHQNRVDWGVSVLSGERDGKRRYLFEGGMERTMAEGHHHLMQRIEQPDRYQQATCARLMTLLAKRAEYESPGAPQQDPTLLGQLEKFRLQYAGGFAAVSWRQSEKNVRARQARERAAQVLSPPRAPKARTAKKSARPEGLWNQAVTLVSESELAPEGLSTTNDAAELRLLDEAVAHLLHGSEHYEQRFDRFLQRYQSTFQVAPTWQAATALLALAAPLTHVCVDPTTFRRQLKALGRPATLAGKVNGALYVRCLETARAIARALAVQGEMPLDLLDVYAFIRATA